MLQPALRNLLPVYPDIKVEILVDYGLTDIVAQGYDTGVRLGEQVAKDMVAMRISPDIRMAVVASPAHLRKAFRAADTARSGGASLHQYPPADLWRVVCLGVRERGPRRKGARGRSAQSYPPVLSPRYRVQHWPPSLQGRLSTLTGGLRSRRRHLAALRMVLEGLAAKFTRRPINIDRWSPQSASSRCLS